MEERFIRAVHDCKNLKNVIVIIDDFCKNPEGCWGDFEKLFAGFWAVLLVFALKFWGLKPC